MEWVGGNSVLRCPSGILVGGVTRAASIGIWNAGGRWKTGEVYLKFRDIEMVLKSGV